MLFEFGACLFAFVVNGVNGRWIAFEIDDIFVKLMTFIFEACVISV